MHVVKSLVALFAAGASLSAQAVQVYNLQLLSTSGGASGFVTMTFPTVPVDGGHGFARGCSYLGCYIPVPGGPDPVSGPSAADFVVTAGIAGGAFASDSPTDLYNGFSGAVTVKDRLPVAISGSGGFLQAGDSWVRQGNLQLYGTTFTYEERFVWSSPVDPYAVSTSRSFSSGYIAFVPEPASWVLVGAGLVAVAWVRRRGATKAALGDPARA